MKKLVDWLLAFSFVGGLALWGINGNVNKMSYKCLSCDGIAVEIEWKQFECVKCGKIYNQSQLEQKK